MKITVKKGLDIKMKGVSDKVMAEANLSKFFAIKPSDFPNLTPKLLVKEGDKVKCGSPVFCDKYNDVVTFVSPASGVVNKVVRGEKRRILAITILSDGKFTQLNSKVKDFSKLDRSELKSDLLKSGLWPLLRMRPIDIIARPEDNPKSIFISSFDTNPLSPDYDFIMHNKSAEFSAGLEILSLLTDGVVNLQIRKSSDEVFSKAKNVQTNFVKGPHPAGNVGVQMHKIDPINKGEVVWYINPQDVMILGRYSLTGAYDANKVISLGGENIDSPKYVKTISGSSIESILDDSIIKDNSRIISGNPLTGQKVEKDSFLGFYHHQLSILPEGDDYKFFLSEGWLSLGFNRFSASKSYPTWLLPKSKTYQFDTNLNGEERSFVVSGQYEKVFPFDIYPVQLIKSIITNDIEKMEYLGIYEVSPEDFALCEFVCTSKINVQSIVREGLDLVYKECM
ncbi:MAG: Na(+)-translocating NADH-quinone reductase subunit A [Flavobacteriales bacterium]